MTLARPATLLLCPAVSAQRPEKVRIAVWTIAVLVGTGSLTDIADAARTPLPPAHPPTLFKEAPKPPFRRRRRTGVKGLVAKDGALIDLSRWPMEPVVAPAHDVERFVSAFRDLCGHNRLPLRRARKYTTWVLQYSSQFSIDPFTLASVVFRQSRCDPKSQGDFGLGLARVHPRMHGEHFVKREGVRGYLYYVLTDDAPSGPRWSERFLPLDKFRFTRGSLLRAERNLYFAAALLSITKQQCPANDGVFGSVPHRHHMSHYYWGDKVRGAGAEDRTLRSRRRLIGYYSGEPPVAKASFEEQPLLSPLDGAPRKITSEMGALRAGGAREHAGIDYESTQGEPVRAIAAGRVAIAGLDRPKGGSISLKPENGVKVARSKMGPGGLYVMINHANGLQSAYMHLAEYRVRTGQKVQAGEIIGWVGRSGIERSGAHLHFELRKDHKHIDPLPIMRPYVFELGSTWRGRRVVREVKRKRKIWRRAARKAARAERAKAREAERKAEAKAQARGNAGTR